MARKQTNTADFFPHRVSHGKTMFKLEAKYGNDGYAFLFKLCEMLGASENHFLDLSDAGDWDFFVMKMRIEEEKCTAILNDLIAWGKLDSELFALRKIVWYEQFVQGLSQLYLNRRRELPVRPHFYCRNDSATGESTAESTQSRVEESREEESIAQNDVLLDSFTLFWEGYDKKVDRKKCETAWKNLTNAKRDLALANIPDYIKANPDKKFRKNPLTYLHGECWHDEIPIPKQQSLYEPTPQPEMTEEEVNDILGMKPDNKIYTPVFQLSQ